MRECNVQMFLNLNYPHDRLIMKPNVCCAGDENVQLISGSLLTVCFHPVDQDSPDVMIQVTDDFVALPGPTTVVLVSSVG